MNKVAHYRPTHHAPVCDSGELVLRVRRWRSLIDTNCSENAAKKLLNYITFLLSLELLLRIIIGPRPAPHTARSHVNFISFIRSYYLSEGNTSPHPSRDLLISVIRRSFFRSWRLISSGCWTRTELPLREGAADICLGLPVRPGLDLTDLRPSILASADLALFLHIFIILYILCWDNNVTVTRP